MRSSTKVLLLILSLSACPLLSRGQVSVLTDFTVSLEGDSLRFPMAVPGTIQEELKARHLIPDPFIGRNEEKVQWVSDRDWTMETTFEVDSDALRSAKAYFLRLKQVDTFGEVYLNGGLVGTTENYFRDYDFEVKEFLKPGTNRLLIRLLSPTKKAHPVYLSSGLNYPADNDRAEIHYSPLVRTAPYRYGWDWGPRLIAMGVDAPVCLERVEDGFLTDIGLRVGLGENFTSARISLSFRSVCASEGLMARIGIFSPEGKLLSQKVISIPSDTLASSVEFGLRNPRLWWPNGMGDRPLYSARIALLRDGRETAAKSLTFGIREIVLDRTKDALGERFAFRVNGRPFYAKGANYLPHERRFREAGDPYSLSKLFKEDLLPVHINMLRIWGGGMYETEEFYNLADSLGILIWQDFPFACSTYPNDPNFRENVAQELRDNLTRIARHPSLALFCGNNEVLEGIEHWGWKKKYGYTDEDWQKMRRDYDDFFRGLLPSLVERYAPGTAYIHGSPISANWGSPESLLSGDSHYWGVWFGGEDFDTFDKNYGRFSSEFGFQAFPEMKTIRAFAPGVPVDSLDIDHPLLQYRQRSFIGNRTITDYMKRAYDVPEKFSDYVYTGQLLQGHGMDYAIRAIRRGYPTNRGLLFWQLNDVWPAISWSSVDYYGNWKALHYKLRSALAPVIVDIVEKEGHHELWLCSDQAIDGSVKITLRAMNFAGQELWAQSKDYVPPVGEPFSNRVEIPDEALFVQNGGQMIVLIQAEGKDGTLLARRLYYPLEPKELRLPPFKPLTEVRVTEGKMVLTLSTETLAKDLYIRTPDEWQGARLSDNFFDLLPGETKTVTITHPAITPHSSPSDLHFQTLNAQ